MAQPSFSKTSLHIRHKKTDIRRLVTDWIRLPEDDVNVTSVNMFKNRIDQYLKTNRG